MYRAVRVAITGATAFVLLAAGSAVAVTTSAQAPESDRNAPETILSPQELAQDTQAQASISPTQSPTNEKLTTNAMKICIRRQAEVNLLMQRINSRAKAQLALITTIAARVETFYVSKSKTVQGYDQLVAAVAEAETKAQAEQSGLELGFNCGANDPKKVALSFVSAVRQEVSDLQAYRTAVKNLIVAVANANGVKIKVQPTGI